MILLEAPPARTVTSVKSRVLVVDDEPAIVRAYQKILSARGYDVQVATDGNDAKGYLERDRFDAVLSDVHMPGMNGIELLRAARMIDLDLPVILVTGAPEDELSRLAVEFGALLYLVKPIEPRVVVQIIEHALRLNRMARQKREAQAVEKVEVPALDDGIEARFTNALAALRMVHQPIVHPLTQTVYGYEALMRTGEPTLANPLALLEAAERLNRLHELGHVVRGRVAETLDQAPPGAAIFVNLHPADLSDPELISPTAPLARHARRVVLEITERASLDRVKNLGRTIVALRQMGYRIAIDDLGAGHSGLATLARLLPEVVKIDMSLVRGLQLEPVKRELIRHLTSLCTEVGMVVVAEGVETVEERDALAAIGCELMQGYLFAKPMTGFQPAAF